MTLDDVTFLQRIRETLKSAASALRSAPSAAVEQLEREAANLETDADALAALLKRETSLTPPAEANFIDLPE